jgi:biopolymer transport protein ExbB/TolQ
VAHAIITSGARTEEAFLTAGDGEAQRMLSPDAQRLPHISLLASVATLLGLLGTIFGLTTAFAAVGAADPTQRSAFLAAGISQALNTTAFGLMVAVPAMIVHGFLIGRVEAIAGHVDEVCVRVSRAMMRAGSAASEDGVRPSPAVAASPQQAQAAARRPAPVR